MKNYSINGVISDSKRDKVNNIEEDALSPIQVSKSELLDGSNAANINSISNYEQSGRLPAEEEDLSDESSISFELYEEEFIREKVISQIKQEQKAEHGEQFDNSEFLLKHYKYRDLSDISNGFGKLITDIDKDLIELVNENYLSFINLGKSIDGSLDLIHDTKIDLNEYLKNLKLSNENIKKDETNLGKLQDSREKLILLKSFVTRLITLSELIDCFDKLISKFDDGNESADILKELVGLYFGINKMFSRLMEHSKENILPELLESNSILSNLSKKMNGLKLEFKGLLKSYFSKVKESSKTNDEVFGVFKLFQLLTGIEDFRSSL